MENLILKIKKVYLPFLLIAGATIVTYTALRWYLDLKLGLIPLKENLLNFWLPLLLPSLPLIVWQRHRNRILNVNGKRENGHFLYLLLMSLAIATPLLIIQQYIQKAAFDLIPLHRIAEVHQHPNERYFKLNTYNIEKQGSQAFATSRTSGRNNESLSFYLYFVSPFSEAQQIWHGIDYQESTTNRASDEAKNRAYQHFLRQSEQRFKDYNFYHNSYFEKLSYSDKRDGFLEAARKAKPDLVAEEQVILIPRQSPFEERLGESYPWIFRSMAISALAVLLMVSFPKINQDELATFKQGTKAKDDDLNIVLGFLNPLGPNKAIAILLLLNLGTFIVMVFGGMNIMSPAGHELLEWGANRRGEVLAGDYWRLFSSLFIHAGLIHLFMNLFGLSIAGLMLQDFLKPLSLITVYLLCGLIASSSSIFWHLNTISVGASGAIFGLYGLALAFNLFKVFPAYSRNQNWLLLALFPGISLVYGFFGGIDNAAHLGGLLAGFLIGAFLGIRLSKKKLS